jgi:hypothetical protein
VALLKHGETNSKGQVQRWSSTLYLSFYTILIEKNETIQFGLQACFSPAHTDTAHGSWCQKYIYGACSFGGSCYFWFLEVYNFPSYCNFVLRHTQLTCESQNFLLLFWDLALRLQALNLLMQVLDFLHHAIYICGHIRDV